jgi:hypothetical protein
MPAYRAHTLPTGRRPDLDWLRVLMFGGLIFYHEGLLYEPGRNLVTLALLATHPWRMSLLFLISGAATRFMWDRHSAAGLSAERSLRLLPPLTFAILIIVPLQAYIALVEGAAYAGGYLDFLKAYFAAPLKVAAPGQLPVYGHLWFVFYLWAYTMALSLMLAVKPGWVRKGERAVNRLGGMGLLLGPYVLLTLLRLVAYPLFPVTLGFIDDWYNHIVSGGLFVMGFLAARAGRFWAEAVRLRWAGLMLAVAGYGAYSALGSQFNAPPEWAEISNRSMGLFYEMERWGALVAVLGFGYRLVVQGPIPAAPRYLTGAIFTYYIVHEPALLAAYHWLKPLHLPAALEAVLVAAVTLATCALAYEAARRVRWVGVALGQRRFGHWSFKKPLERAVPAE